MTSFLQGTLLASPHLHQLDLTPKISQRCFCIIMANLPFHCHVEVVLRSFMKNRLSQCWVSRCNVPDCPVSVFICLFVSKIMGVSC
eukprot:m.121896 g.121896  ORF g.121896 m.121896 type:complete len:86 (+) comp12931_c1_seq3:1074-1331(+)